MSDMEQQIKEKVEAQGVPLKEWDIQINYGIKTGFNDAFIISGEIKDRLIAEDAKSAEIIRPILRGRDIKRYSYSNQDLWLINVHNGIKDEGIPPIDVNEYPSIKAYLDLFYPKLAKRADKGDTPYNLRNCAYMNEFNKQKIIYPNMTKYLPFLLDEEGFVTNQKCFIITGENIGYLTAFFNSNIFKFCFRDSFPELLGGTRELSKIFFDKIPIKSISSEDNDYLTELVRIIEQKRKAGLQAEEENLVERYLYKMYDISDTEALFIESRLKEIGLI